MDVISGRTEPPPSSLNPNAPMFVPLAYRTVEDFSKEWWDLVQSSPWFRDYWVQECFTDPTQNPENDPFFPDINDLAFSDVDALFDEEHYQPDTITQAEEEEEEEKDLNKELVSLGLLKWRKGRAVAEAPRYIEKAPKFVNVKVSPRAIQQPR